MTRIMCIFTVGTARISRMPEAATRSRVTAAVRAAGLGMGLGTGIKMRQGESPEICEVLLK